MRKGLCLLLAALFLVVFIPAESCAGEAPRRVLIYMLASDLETDSAAATKDLHEMLRSSGQVDCPELFVCISGARELWFPGLEPEHGYVLNFRDGQVSETEDLGIGPGADGKRILYFLNEYGADGADLILWGHGQASLDGIGFDELYDADMLSVPEILAALEQSGLHLRLIGFDACEMACFETAWMLAPYGEYFAASAEIEELSGWDYPKVLTVLGDPVGEDLPDRLRSVGLQGAGRTPDRELLTVIETDRLLGESDALNGCFKTGERSRTLRTLGDLAEACADREAGEAIQNLLNGQTLRFYDISAVENLTPEDLPEIGDEYLSFQGRK